MLAPYSNALSVVHTFLSHRTTVLHYRTGSCHVIPTAGDKPTGIISAIPVAQPLPLPFTNIR